MIKRTLAEKIAKSKKSVLLLGPRQTGKSTLMRSLKPDLTINLAREETYLEFARNSSELEERLSGEQYKTVLIDEIQRLPSMLNTIQAILDESASPPKFYLTGSSARKLKRGKANLLPGRIHAYELGSLTAHELKYSIDIKQALSTGTLPGIWTEESRKERQKTLQSYAAAYLKEEIQAEALTRNVEGFSRFLFLSAAESGKFLDMEKLSSEAQIVRQSAARYFDILTDTLIIRRCEPFSKSLRKRLILRPKFFFFDCGVLNGLIENFTVSQDRIGMLFEHLIFNQIMDSAHAKDSQVRISSYRTSNGAEVDFILEIAGEVIAAEVKASKNIRSADTRGFKSFAEYYDKKHRSYIVYMGNISKTVNGVRVLPWQKFLQEIGL